MSHHNRKSEEEKITERYGPDILYNTSASQNPEYNGFQNNSFLACSQWYLYAMYTLKFEENAK